MTLEEVSKVIVPLQGSAVDRLEEALRTEISGVDRDALATRLLERLAGVPSMTVEAAEWTGDARLVRAADINAASEIGRALTKMASAASRMPTSAGTVYRMVVPAHLAAGMSRGALRPMQDAAGVGLRSALVDGAHRIRGQASFEPVSLGRGAVVASVGVTFGLALVTAALEHQARRDEMERLKRIEEKLDDLVQESRDREFRELKTAWQLMKEAAAVLVDGQKLGRAMGLDAAAFAAHNAFQGASLRVARWKEKLAKLEATPTPDTLQEQFPTLADGSGRFDADLNMTFSAIELERARMLLVTEETVRPSDSPSVEKIKTVLQRNLTDVASVESDLIDVANRLSSVQLKMPDGILSGWWSNGRTEEALRMQHGLHLTAGSIRQALEPASDKQLAVDIVYESDGSMTLLDPAWVRQR